MKKEKNNFGFIAASSICIFLLLIVLVGNVGGKGTRAVEYEYNGITYVCDSFVKEIVTDQACLDRGGCSFYSPENNEYIKCLDGECYVSPCEVKSASDDTTDTPDESNDTTKIVTPAPSAAGYSCTGEPEFTDWVNFCGYHGGVYAQCTNCVESQEANNLVCEGYIYNDCVKENSSGDGQTCSAGQYLLNGTCTTCPENSYCPGDGTITSCPTDKPESPVGSDSVSDCVASTTCSAGQYLDGTICKSCDNVLEGSTSNANSVGSTSCVCPSGKTANNNKCIDIIAGCNKYASDGECETCLGRGTLSNGKCTFSKDISNCSDYYTTNDSRYGKCKSCKTGYYVSKDLLSCTTDEEKMEYPIPTCRDTVYTGSTIDFSNKLSYTSGFEIISGQSAKDVGDHRVTLRLTSSNYVWAGTSSTETSVVCKIVDPGTCDVTLSESSRTDSTISFAANITKSSDDLTIKSYDWTSSNSKVIPNFSGMNKTTAKLSGTGTTTVKLNVTLSSGKTCTSSLSVTIDKFVQPCDIKFAGTTHTAVNSSFTVSVSDSSVLPDSITGYSWSIGGATGSSISSGASSKEVTVSKAKYYGYDNLNLTLTLKDGSTCSDTFTFKKSCDSSQTVYDNKYCCSTKTEMLGTSAECSVVGGYIGKYHNNIGILQSVEQLSAGTTCRLTYNVCDNYSGPSGGGDDSGDDLGDDSGDDSGSDNGGNNGGDNGGIGGGDDTGNNNGGNNNATNNPQTGSALIFVVWSIGIAMVVYAFWYFKTSKEY